MPLYIRTDRRVVRSLFASAFALITVPAYAQGNEPAQAPVQDGGAEVSLSNPSAPAAGPSLERFSPRLEGLDPDDRRVLRPRAPGAGQLSGKTVLERQRPEYDPVGLRAGGFQIFPQVLTEAGYDSNVFTQRNANSDIYARLRGDLLVQSDFGRHALGFGGYVEERAFAQQKTESGITYSASASGRLDISTQSSLSANVERSHLFVNRGSSTEVLLTRKPVRYDRTTGEIGAHTQRGRFAFDLTGLVSEYDYDDALTPDGRPSNQQFRDTTRYEGRLEVGYGSGAGPQIFASFAADFRRFRLESTPDRDSDGIEILAGVRGDITPLIRGRVGVGYIRANFKDPTVDSRQGIGIDAQIDYLVTELTTLRLSARRSFKNVSSVTTPAAFTTEFVVGADHELLRNLILSARAAYEYAKYTDFQRRVRNYRTSIGAYYFVNRRMAIEANASYGQARASDTRDYREVNAALGVIFQL